VWKRSGAAIPGATDAQYKLVADKNKLVTVTVGPIEAGTHPARRRPRPS
jgi:hypothetical protein